MSKDGRGIPETCKHGAHGLRAMQSALAKIPDDGEDWLDALGPVGAVVRELRDDLIRDLGGPGCISTAQGLIVQQVAKSWVMLQSIDDWMLTRPLMNKRARALFPVVLQRQTLEDSLVRNLRTLGLERKTKPTPSLPEYLATRVTDAEESAQSESERELQAAARGEGS